MSGIVGSINTRGSGLINLGSAADGNVFTGTGAGLPVGFEAAAGGGKVGQIVVVTKTNTTSITATASWADLPGLTITITPVATSSKIWLTTSVNVFNWSTYSFIKIVRNVDGGSFSEPTGFIGDAASSRHRTTYPQIGNGGGGDSSGGGIGGGESSNLLDSPNTTTAVIYKIQNRNNSGSYATVINRSHLDADSANGYRCVSTMTAVEILA